MLESKTAKLERNFFPRATQEHLLVAVQILKEKIAILWKKRYHNDIKKLKEILWLMY